MPRTNDLIRLYLLNLMMTEGHGRQTLVIRTIKYLADTRLLTEEQLLPLDELLETLLKHERETALRQRILLPSSELERVRECAVEILILAMKPSDDPDPVASDGLDPLDCSLYDLIRLRLNHRKFRNYLDALVPCEVTLYSACAAMLGTTRAEVFRRLQPHSDLCSSGLLEHLGEAGYCLDDVCRLTTKRRLS